jgi:hypothetical protein
MADAESIRQSVESRAPFSTWLGVVLLFALFGIIVAAVIGPSSRTDNYEQIRAKNRIEKLKAIRETDAKQLTTYSWIDKNKGAVGLPIDRAMELTVTELAAKKPAAAYPIATPTPAGAANAAASPAPAASAAKPAASPQPSAAPAAAASSPAANASPAPPKGAASPAPAASPSASASPAPAKAPLT